MNALLMTHSTVRYFVLGVAVLGFLALAGSALGRRPAANVARSVGGALIGLLDLQVLIGIALVAFRGSPIYRAIWFHIALMVAAAVLAHVCFALNRKRGSPGYALPFVAVLGALVLIVCGILVLGRPVVG